MILNGGDTMQNKQPLILVTNDDGIHASGIDRLINLVRPYGKVVVVAPDQSFSAMSHAITVKYPLYVHLVKKEKDFVVYKSNGTPADCIKLAINTLLDDKPDVIVSGINHGSNSSVSIHYSGTLGAAREGAINGIPSVGFSLLSYEATADFSHCVNLFKPIFEHVLRHGLPRGVFLNVNAPVTEVLRGVRVCRQAKGRWVEEFVERVDPRHQKYYWLTGHFENHEPDAADTDEYALMQGYVSVVPCITDLTCPDTIVTLKHLNHDMQVQ